MSEEQQLGHARPRRYLDVEDHWARIESLRQLAATDPQAQPLRDPEHSKPAPLESRISKHPRTNPTALIDWFERVVVVNLDRRPDRWQGLLEHLEAIDWPFREPQRFRAVDGRQVKPPRWWKVGGGAWGCLQSHLRIIENAMLDELDSVLILEDDALFVPDLGDRAGRFLAAMPTDWHQIYFGGQHLRQGQRAPLQVNDEVLRPFNVNRTHAFALHKSFFVPVYRWLTDFPEHARHPRHHVDHRLGELHETGRYNIYAPTRWLAGQNESHSNIKGKVMPTRYWNRHRVHDETMPFVAVIGLHRSGSSCIAGVLHKLGVYMGDHLGGYEPSGGYEARGLARLCERAYPFPSTERHVGDEELVAGLRRHVQRVRGAARVRGCAMAGGKYPHLCAMGDVLRMAVGDRLRIVHIDRPLEHSIASLQARSRRSTGWLRIDDEQADVVQRFLWEQKRALLDNAVSLTVDYRNLVENPRREIDRLVDFLGLDPRADDRAHAQAHVEQNTGARSCQ